MQSQQKKVKWSRGETSDALEERTDTGITNVSVALLENCVTDIYGNISRRPAMHIRPDARPLDGGPALGYGVYSFIFSISEDRYFVLFYAKNTAIRGWEIQNDRVIRNVEVDISGVTKEDLSALDAAPTVCQYNNYMIVFNMIRRCMVIRYDPVAQTLKAEKFVFQGPWYAPSGTETRSVNQTILPGLVFNADELGFVQYLYTENGQTDVYYTIDTGLPTSSINSLKAQIPLGSIVEFPKMGAYMRVEGFHYNNTVQSRMPTAKEEYPTDRIYMFGALLTPVADEKAKDTSAKVEYGYIQLDDKDGYEPTTGVFANQRLYIGNFMKAPGDNTGQTFIPGFIVGSQIGRYTDFKNNYNMANEPVNIDMSTKYQEVVQHLMDYNGIKIFTDVGEYAYETGVAPQSKHGSDSICHPILFNSLVLYLDNTKRHIRALQYELQQSIFNSSIVNKLTGPDLIDAPTALTRHEDKEHSTGHYLYCLQPKNKSVGATFEKTSPSIAVCNFVPDSQNIIWGRWQLPKQPVTSLSGGETVVGSVEFNDKVWFICEINQGVVPRLVLAELSYVDLLDYQGTARNGVYSIANNWGDQMNFVGPVSVFDGDVWMWDDVADTNGKLQKSTAGLKNPIAGVMINATVHSHPVDVGGRTKTVVKRISKATMSVRDTKPGAITINNKTGYMNPAQDMINFYGVTGMKREIIYTLNNVKGAKFHLESLTLNLEYGTLIS